VIGGLEAEKLETANRLKVAVYDVDRNPARCLLSMLRLASEDLRLLDLVHFLFCQVSARASKASHETPLLSHEEKSSALESEVLRAEVTDHLEKQLSFSDEAKPNKVNNLILGKY